MKVTRRELNNMINDYMKLDEQVRKEKLAISSDSFAPESCDFVPDKEFLQFFTVFFKGKDKKGGFGVSDEELPTWISPAFTTFFTDAAGPLLNAYGLIPVFNQKGKCNLLSKIQNIFIKYKKAYEQGIAYNIETEPPPGSEALDTDDELAKNTAAGKDILSKQRQSYLSFMAEIDRLYKERKLPISTSAKSSFMDPENIKSINVTLGEIVFASYVAGNLDYATHSDMSLVHQKLQALLSNPSVTASDIISASNKLNSDQKLILEKFLNSYSGDLREVIAYFLVCIEKLNGLHIFR